MPDGPFFTSNEVVSHIHGNGDADARSLGLLAHGFVKRPADDCFFPLESFVPEVVHYYHPDRDSQLLLELEDSEQNITKMLLQHIRRHLPDIKQRRCAV